MHEFAVSAPRNPFCPALEDSCHRRGGGVSTAQQSVVGLLQDNKAKLVTTRELENLFRVAVDEVFRRYQDAG